jgi:hypothetical protein
MKGFLLAVAAGFVVAGCGEVVAFAGGSGPREFGRAETAFNITDARVDESSGVAPSFRVPDTYFTHNDSGDSARFFRFDSKGVVKNEYRVANAKNVDWEDMATAKLDGVPYVFLGDIGDNSKRRKSIFVYRVLDPGDNVREVAANATYELTYPTGPQNAETLLVHPKTGDIYVISKSTGDSQVYFLSSPKTSGKYTLTQLGHFRVGGFIKESRRVTGGAFSPDGRHVVVRTYMGAYEFPVKSAGAEWWKEEPRKIRTNFDHQGEAISYSLNGSELYTTSEFSPCQVSRIAILGKDEL